ncbi:ChaB-3 [Hemileuca sp. nucleopolyhedrovirus]|uniref:ChaB-3 n=1 Tax=Hemileuca sp. nucleopolyhedrovirus TaxID=1367203 RepID=S5MQK4_9ABAC|nr:ChaB-3 [Hemileuca sp. nucleopolyhedrovirus]AGR56879.1 ChaB-3 [Hemileuca sp. nucleopolyhedrovirus]
MYDNVHDLPASVRNALPLKAQRMYMHVFNSAYGKYDNPYQVAWGVVAKYYERPKGRRSNQKWKRRSKAKDNYSSNYQDNETDFDSDEDDDYDDNNDSTTSDDDDDDEDDDEDDEDY